MEKEIGSNNYDVIHEVEEGRLFSIKEIAKMLDCSLLEIRNIINYYHINFEKKVSGNGARYAFYSYQAFKRIELLHESRKEKVRDKKNILCRKVQKEKNNDMDEHPLVTDKRCLDLNWWPDITPSCFADLDEN